VSVSHINRYDGFGLYIDGVWQAPGPATIAVLDPSTGQEIGAVPDATSADLDRALAAAASGFSTWRRVQPWERSATLRRIASLIRDRVESLSELMTAEAGKPLAEARAEWGAAADQFEWYAEETKRIYGQLIEARQPDVRLAVIYQPIGVVAAFTAWNFPAILPARKIAPALGAGCSIIIKPAGEAPGSGMGLVQACHDAGLPPGVVNLVTGQSQRIAEHLVRSPIVRKVSLTGSVPVGKAVLRLAADGVKKVTMELGGHAPVLVFADADVAKAADAAATAKFRNGGQVCISPSRFYVHEDIYEPFTHRFVEVARRLKIGRGCDRDVTLGPLANARGLETTKRLVADAIACGAELLTGGKAPEGFTSGFFFDQREGR
jgi:succinate-semialdehyde dehydrogenase/glutarate-semialdehyde dehydrogenase